MRVLFFLLVSIFEWEIMENTWSTMSMFNFTCMSIMVNDLIDSTNWLMKCKHCLSNIVYTSTHTRTVPLKHLSCFCFQIELNWIQMTIVMICHIKDLQFRNIIWQCVDIFDDAIHSIMSIILKWYFIKTFLNFHGKAHYYQKIWKWN